ncbi:MAG: PQQ-binding-like beta-propeller repeat protein [Saprospiraceae bacterium]|nr:PQQ-binding-like beta-propeller repeat protein [Saprospiraceae bacterium]
MKTQNQPNTNIKLWKGIAYVAGVFSFILCVLLIANYLQINTEDPVNTKVIESLVKSLNDNPDNIALKEQIREMDLLARKAYFTSQWQIRFGGYLLLIGIAVLVIAMQMISSAKKISPEVSNEKADSIVATQKNARKWISIIGTALVITALIFAYLSHNEMGKTFSKLAEKKSNDTEDVVKKAEVENTKQAETLQADSIKTDSITEEDLDTYYPTIEEIKKNYASFRGFGGNGISYHKNIPTKWNGKTGENIKWKTEIPLKGYNSPIVWDDKIFLAGAENNKREVYCIDKNTGKFLWKALVDNIPGSAKKFPEVTDDTGHSAPTLVTDGKRVYAIFSNGDIIAFDFDGNRVWAKNLGLPSNHYGHSSSLMMHKNMVIVQYDMKGSAKIMALSSNSGNIVWTTKREDKISWASPIIVNTGNQTEIILVSEPNVASYNADSGKELWKLNCMYGEVGPSCAYADGIVYALNEYAVLVAIKAGKNPEILWEGDEYLSDVPSPVANDKYLFVVTSYGAIACYDAKKGTQFWEQEFPNGFYSSPILVDGKIYAIDRQGIMHIFKADKTYKSIGTNELGEKSDCTPAFMNGKIYIRGEKNLYCVGK